MDGPAYKLWNIVFQKQHLLDLYNEKIRNKDTIGLDFVSVEAFSQQLNEQIETIERKCEDCTYHFTSYRQLLISKGAEKPPRCISIPTVRDKIVLSAINEIIIGVYGVKQAITPMPQMIIQDIMDAVQSKKYDTFIKIDIKSFYASINHKKLLKKIKAKIRKKELYTLIENAIKTDTHTTDSKGECKEREKGVPEGLSISNALANLYLNELDKKFSSGGSVYQYWRYVDDILLLTNKEYATKLKSDIERELKKLKLTNEPKKTKTGSIDDGFEYLGYTIKGNSVSVRKSSIVKLERTLEDIFRHYKLSKDHNEEYLRWKINLKISGFIVEDNKYGWVFFYSQINNLQCLYHLDWFLQKMSARYSVDYNQFKRFVRAYHEIKNAIHETRYIINIDKMTIAEKREIVKQVYKEDIDDKDDEWVNRRFRKLMNREKRDIQRDVQAFS